MDGKTMIHPSQLAVTNEIFAPDMEEVEAAERLIQAHEVRMRTTREKRRER